MISADEWNTRAALAERAVLERYAGGFPGVRWARSAWPLLPAAQRRPDNRASWHYWWSAHLVEAAVDAVRHRPDPARRRRARAFVRGVRLRNGGTWSRPFYDDLAWMGLALERGADVVGHRRAAERISRQLEAAIDPEERAVPWRVGTRFFNAPANGPAAILFARTGRGSRAIDLADWIDRTLLDPASGLVIDGVDGARRATELYTYCQGVALGAQIDAARLDPARQDASHFNDGDGDGRFARRAVALVEAISAWTGPTLVLPGAGGGDRGLFAAIACRYLAEASASFENRADAGPSGDALRTAAASARAVVIASAEAAWNGRATIDGLPVFAVDWRCTADPSSEAPERDLSVQLGAWIALEAAVEVTRN